ncbi:hypothetical protein BH23THE1_BH23THE1_12820 [soil metagenome]
MVMKPCFDGVAAKQSPSKRNTNKRIRINSLYACTLLILIGSIGIFWGIKDADAQSSSIFRVIVQVQNTGNLDEHGVVHVAIDGSRNPQTQTNLIFPALQTSSFTFDFSSAEAPVNKGFTAEVVYGDDEIKSVSGVNTPANTPETVTLIIP